MDARKVDRSLGELFGNLARDMGVLVRKEVWLATHEVTRSLASAGRDVGFLAAGGLVVYAGFLGILAAIILGLAAAGLPWWLASLLVGVVVAIIGAIVVQRSLAALKGLDFVPRQTVETLKEDTEWMKEQVT